MTFLKLIVGGLTALSLLPHPAQAPTQPQHLTPTHTSQTLPHPSPPHLAPPQPPPPLLIHLDSNWSFSADSGHTWRPLHSGASWEKQGIVHEGWGWYRQLLLIPKEYTGYPLVLTLATFPSDDELFINGARAGGFSSEYKYGNQLLRKYTIPAALLHYGQPNRIDIHTWGGNLSFIGKNSGLVAGPYTALVDPYRTGVLPPHSPEQPLGLYDFSSAQHGQPFQLVFRFPTTHNGAAAVTLHYTLKDYYGGPIGSGGEVPLHVDKDGFAIGLVPVDSSTAQTIYLRGRFKADLRTIGSSGQVLQHSTVEADPLSFTSRDTHPLPAAAPILDNTPYGKLRRVDEIDCSLPLNREPHPYLESGFAGAQSRNTPGSAVNVTVSEILGKQARSSANGWFAYRVGRGRLQPRRTYLLRIEYAEDKPRYCPIEIQIGQNYMDVGWENGISPDDPYDNWPLSKSWQWYDVIVPLDDETVGAGGTGSASAANGFWIYFMNKIAPGKYYSIYDGGPAIARIRLYEIDAMKNAPLIHTPEGLPRRALLFDWERQPDHEPADLVRYAKLMGYSAISPLVLKWAFANYSEPLNGYHSVNIDARNYWVTRPYDPLSHRDAAPAVPGKPSVHLRYLSATRQLGVGYIPRFEYGGSLDLPTEARAVAPDGSGTKPDRFADWCADLLHPATEKDMLQLMDHLFKPYIKDNPQFTGALWRIRSDRMPISYSPFDIRLFATETGTTLPPGPDTIRSAWASSGPGKELYADWWHRKREQFHARLVDHMKTYRPGLTLYYYNWDEDKFSLVLPDEHAWAFLGKVASAPQGNGRAVYETERRQRKGIDPKEYIRIIHSGDFGETSKGINRPDYGLRPPLYNNLPGMELFAPANALYLANDSAYLNYFRTAEGVAVSNAVSYDEVNSRSINPKFEGNMITPAGAPFSMALELLSWFHSDVRTLTYTAYTYGRGFAAAHRRFAQAFLALPAVKGLTVDNDDPDTKIRIYPTNNGTYIGIGYKGYRGKTIHIRLPGEGKPGVSVKDLVTRKTIPATRVGKDLLFDIGSGPMELNTLLIK